ncbi:MAG: c-type cytochrome [Hyphomicrobium sp.]
MALMEPGAVRGDDTDEEPSRARSTQTHGRDLFDAWCSRCHGGGGDTSFAPTLKGVIGRKAGTVPGYPYTPRITGLDITWSAEILDKWLFGLSTESPTTSIRHLGVQNARDRAALIAYIEALAAP